MDYRRAEITELIGHETGNQPSTTGRVASNRLSVASTAFSTQSTLLAENPNKNEGEQQASSFLVESSKVTGYAIDYSSAESGDGEGSMDVRKG